MPRPTRSQLQTWQARGAAGAFLLAHADELLRQGVGAEVLRILDELPVLCVMALAAVGQFEEAEEVVRMMDRCLPASADNIEVSWSRMLIRYERGERAEPLAYFSRMQRVFDRGGHQPGAIWTRAMTCRLLFLLGRRHEALAELAWMRDVCARSKTSAYDRVIDRAAAEDPLGSCWVTGETAFASAETADIRARVKAIVRLVFHDRVADDRLLPGVTIPDRSDYGLDRALFELARAGIARHRGQSRVEMQCLRKAAAQAADGGADDNLIPRMYEAWLHVAPKWDPNDLVKDACTVIDGVRHEIRIGARRIAFGARPVARQLLYAFAAAPSNYLTRNMIARVLWGADYDPLRHECSQPALPNPKGENHVDSN